MDLLKRFNNAIEYLESHLADTIDYEEVAKIACCSIYNFQRMFSYILDISPSEYVRRRRLTLAALELQNSDIKIIDLAMKYGYESHDAFTRAFQKIHGVTPSRARQQGVMLRSYPRISFHISIKGDQDMRYTIVDKEDFEIFGIEEVFSTVTDQDNNSVSGFWKSCHATGAYEKLFDAANFRKRGEDYTGMCSIHAALNYRNTGKETFPYMLFAFASSHSQTQGYTSVTIPAQKWAIFTSELHGEDQMGIMTSSLWRRVYSEWLPSSGYEKLEGPDIEIYGRGENKQYYSEVWIPVVKK
ncbi:AraC family transcriptional regulator [Paenibacillus turicensis]|uniref:AraC family transcriptional regulator n=1 Tax=Paenibacillus turicensis TaxID=160487 RepID=A0ABS4FLW0_9BACL|nr:helix-turn-helix domain-containing protein [Paenibacillus turicensis]MBP1903566.1 AraC family transcriptional regulator [Paenibacillus turicensis]